MQEVALGLAEESIQSNVSLANACIQLLGSDDPRVRMQASLSLSRINAGSELYRKISNSLFVALLEACKNEQNEWIIAAHTLAAKDQAKDLFEELLPLPGTSGNLLASLALRASSTEAGALTILESLSESPITTDDQKLILEQLITNANPSMAKSLEGLIESIEGSNVDLLADLAALRSKLKLPESPAFLSYSQEALRLVLETSLPDSVRLRQLELIGLLPYASKADVLFNCLQHTQPSKIQEGCISAVGQVSGKGDWQPHSGNLGRT